MKSKVYIEHRESCSYPDSRHLFAPGKFYPEYPFHEVSNEENVVYDMLRCSLIGLELDKDNYGTPNWNPLGQYIKPGDIVLLKPNMVKDCITKEQYACTLTHPSIIKAVIDYCVIAKAGKIIIGDAPIQGADFTKIRKDLCFDKLENYYRNYNINISFLDFRDLVVKQVNGIIVTENEKTKDPDKYITVELGNKSEHYQHNFKGKYEICGYTDEEMNKYHKDNVHNYVIHKSVLEADVIINLPKPKTHRFAGITAAQKNFVGCCSDKESLPHFKAGSTCIGGDETNSNSCLAKKIAWNYRKYLWACKKNEYKRAYIYYFFYRMFNWLKKDRFYIHGAWYGNDTIWRTIIDLNTIILYCDKNGIFSLEHEAKNILNIGDMMVVGEKDGPLNPSPRKLKMLMISENAAIFDYIFCKMIGFDEELIPTVYQSIRNKYLSPKEWKKIKIYSNNADFNYQQINEFKSKKKYKIEAHPYWKDVLEK